MSSSRAAVMGGATTLLRPTISRRTARQTRTGARAPLRVHNLFTGIVQGTAAVAEVVEKQDARSFRIAFPEGATKEVQQGASVAINGTCLTVVSIEADQLGFDVIGETLRATNLGKLINGSPVNFESLELTPLRVHHATVQAAIDKIEKSENNIQLAFKLKDADFIKYILPKGFVAVDGCSLTVGEVGEDWFTVYLIPETLRVTVFGTRKEGESVNIEVDSQTQTIVDTVERAIAERLG